MFAVTEHSELNLLNVVFCRLHFVPSMSRPPVNKKTVEEREKALGIPLSILSLCFFIFGFLPMPWASRYPVVWRDSMFMNAPISLCLASFLSSVVIVCFINRWAMKNWDLPINLMWSYGIWLCIGLPMTLGFTQAGLVLNGAADTSQTQIFQTKVTSKRISNSGKSKNKPSWYLNIRDWKHEKGTVQIEVSWFRYDQTAIGEPVQVITKPGYLGYEWLVSHS